MGDAQYQTNAVLQRKVKHCTTITRSEYLQTNTILFDDDLLGLAARGWILLTKKPEP